MLGDARPGHARRRRCRAGRRLVHARHAGRAARDARRHRARARRGRRMGGAAHRHGVRAGGAVRRRGRRVPDPRPQRLRRPHLRRVGARDRGRALSVPRGRVAGAVDARAAATAPLAQGRRRDPGGRADGRRRRRSAPRADGGAPGRRARPARRVDGRVPVVAAAAPRGGATAPRRGGGVHGPRAAARLGGPRRAEPAEPAHARRVRAAPARAPRRRRRGGAAAHHRAPRTGRRRGSGVERARTGEGPRHRVLHGVRPAVQARRRLELRGNRHRDAARRDRQLERGPRRRRGGRARRGAARAPRPGARARDPGRGRPPRLGASGGGRVGRGLDGPARRRRARSPPRAPPPWPSTRCRQSGPAWRTGRSSPA